MHYHLTINDSDVTLNARPIDVPAGTDPHQAGVRALLREARATLATGQGGDVTIETPAGRWSMVVVDGRLLTPQHARERHNDDNSPAAQVAARPAAQRAWARDTNGPLLTPGTRTHARVSRRGMLTAAGGVSALVALGYAARSCTRDSPSAARASTTLQPRASVPALPDGQNAPAGWSPQASWALGDLAHARPTLAYLPHAVLLLRQPAASTHVTLACVDARDGRIRWESDLGAGVTILAGPTILPDAHGRRQVYLITDTDLTTWDPATGRRTSSVRLPHRSPTAGINARGPWINDHDRRYLAPHDTTLVPFDLPKDAVFISADKTHLLAADSHGATWDLTSGKPAPAARRLPGPKGWQAGAITAITSSLLIIGWNADGKVRLGAYHLPDLKPAWTSAAEPAWAAFLGTTNVSPDESWAIVGNRRVDLKTGEEHLIAPRWTTFAISDDYAWGSDGHAVLTCTKGGTIWPARTNAPTPANTILVSGGINGKALVTGAVGQTVTLYALRPEHTIAPTPS